MCDKNVEFVLTDDHYHNLVMRVADMLSGYSNITSTDAIIEYCSRPDISKRHIERIIESLTEMIKH